MPQVMALLGLPVPRHSLGVFIDDVVGSIGQGDEARSMIGANCSAEEQALEAGPSERRRQDRMCAGSYAPDEDPSSAESTNPWSKEDMAKYRHALFYRDLYQQARSRR